MAATGAQTAMLACLAVLVAYAWLPAADAKMVNGSRRRLLKAQNFLPGHNVRDPINCKVVGVSGVKKRAARRTSDCGLRKGDVFYQMVSPKHEITIKLSTTAGGDYKYDSDQIRLVGARDRAYDTRLTDAETINLKTEPYAHVKIIGRKSKKAKTGFKKTSTVTTVVWKPLNDPKTLACTFKDLCGCQGRMHFVFKDLKNGKGGLCSINWPPEGFNHYNFFFSIPAGVKL